jgi:hypothetical protein
MSHMLLEILAEDALKGSKPSSTFNQNLLLRWLQKLVKSSTCNVSLSIWTIISRLWKKNGGIITKLKNKSGCGWDDCLKMITVSKDVYDEEVKVW